MNQQKRVIILEHGGGELSNQLWNFISLYAYCCERGYKLENYSFFEYAPWFRVVPKNLMVRLLFFLPFGLLKLFGGYQTMAASLPFRLLKKIIRFVYQNYVRVVKARNQDLLVSSANGVIRLDDAGNPLDAVLAGHDTVYCSGWLFRNSGGIQKYREKILDYIRPRESHLEKPSVFINKLRRQYNHIIGVHIRQRNSWDTPLSQGEDLALWGSYKAKPFFYRSHLQFIDNFIKEYARVFDKDLSRTCFVVCSNKRIVSGDFKGINWFFHGGSLIEDILVLSGCDAIIGSDSTLSALASWWGNIPMVPMQEKPDWQYYLGRTAYAEDKNLTAVHY